tara:strand:+ start:6132 stop:7100 length:969 start_codon:yes stop_codon:yes gene_type:complete
MSANNLVDRNLEANVTRAKVDGDAAAQSFQHFLSSPALSNTFKVSLGLGQGGNNTDTDLSAWLNSAGVFRQSSPERFNFLCSDASLPGTNLSSFEETGARQGVTEFFAQSRAYVDLNLKFYLSSDYQVLKLFQEWMNFINPIYAANGGMRNRSGNPKGYPHQADSNGFKRFRYPNSYKRIIKVTKFEKNIGSDKRTSKDHLFQDSSKAYMMSERPGIVQPTQPPDKPNPLTYIFTNAFPESVDSIPLSYGDAQILQVVVNFKYDRYVISQTENNGEPSTFASSMARGRDGSTNLSGTYMGSVQSWNNMTDITGHTLQNETQI